MCTLDNIPLGVKYKSIFETYFALLNNFPLKSISRVKGKSKHCCMISVR